ncbi:MAG TPA: hypothetical protein VFU02_21890 [Polyangiaceae bacterium]|nr:hypothetical protein [Polyangiaceae bacterium]
MAPRGTKQRAKPRPKQRAAHGRVILALLVAAGAVTCAKVEDNAPSLASGAGGSTGVGPMGTSAQNTTTITTASSTTAASTGNTSGSATGAATSAGGGQGGEAGASGDDGTADSSGTGGGGTGGSSTTGVPPDVIENARVVLLYKVDSPAVTTTSLFMHLYLRNQSDEAFPLNAAEVRYWLDPDGRSFALASHYQGPGIGAVSLARGSDGDDEYVAVTFAATASLDANTTDINRNEFQVKLDASGGSFDQSNDYSFAPTLTSPTEHDRITVYLADQLVWGCEPSGACAGDDPGAGGAAGAAGAEG